MAIAFVSGHLFLTSTTAITFVMGRLLLASTAATSIQPRLWHRWGQIIVARATTITLAGVFLDTGGGNGYCIRDRPPLSGTNGSNLYPCFGWWQPCFWHWWGQIIVARKLLLPRLVVASF